MTTSSRNQGVNKLIQTDGDEPTKQYVRAEYNIPDHVTSWPDIDDMAFAEQKRRNEEWYKNNRGR